MVLDRPLYYSEEEIEARWAAQRSTRVVEAPAENSSTQKRNPWYLPF
jgi:hypothetical protein